MNWRSTNLETTSAARNARGGSRKTGWQELVTPLCSEKECLALFIALESAEILAGEKPANLINVANRKRSCGRNLYDLWKHHGRDVLTGSDLAVVELADRNDSLLLLVYNPEMLQALLKQRNVAAVLCRAGYSDPADLGKAMEELKSRLKASSFPHEIGVFLGYPLKDVVGFMGWANLPFTMQGPWKIYGNPAESLKLATIHRQCRCLMAQQLSNCLAPSQLLKNC